MRATSLEIEPRSLQFAAVASGLVLMYACDFLTLRPATATLCGFLGLALYVSQLIPAASLNEESSAPQAHAYQSASAISSFACICLFVAGHLIRSPLWLHGLVEIGAGASLFICWSLPTSRWTQATMIPIFFFVILQTNWRVLGAIAKFPPILLVAMAIAWVGFSLIAFRIIDRRKRHLQRAAPN